MKGMAFRDLVLILVLCVIAFGLGFGVGKTPKVTKPFYLLRQQGDTTKLAAFGTGRDVNIVYVGPGMQVTVELGAKERNGAEE